MTTKMHQTIYIASLSVFCFVVQAQYINTRTDNNDYYIGAVVEYASIYDAKNSPEKIMETNLANYINYIKEAKQQNADIIVFPECGLTSIHIPSKPVEAIKYTSLIPDPKDKVVPCNTKGSTSTILERISCEAKENNIYVVVNLPERYPQPNNKDNFLLYNANVVFDRNGAVIARYRKYNLFGERAFNKTKIPELITFDTDFGVTFGTFICFDILFAEPAMTLLRETKVTDIVYPTAWFSSLPFLTAIQVQAGWARANQVNLLAAGYDNPEFCSGGSGIFSGNNGIADYLVPTDKTSHLLVSRINKIKNKHYNDIKKPTQCKSTLSGTNFLHTIQENLSNYTTQVLKGDVSDRELCHDTFCCKFTARFNKQDTTVTHMMVAYRGLRRFMVEWNTVEICGIVTCANGNKDSCGLRLDNVVDNTEFNEVQITGNFDKDEHFVHIPSTVLYSLDPLPYGKYSYKTEIQKNNKVIEMKTNEKLSHMLGFAVYGIKKNLPESI